MGNFVKIIGRDIYIFVPDLDALHRLYDWSQTRADDIKFRIDQPFSSYPNIHKIPGDDYRNVTRMASQIGTALSSERRVTDYLRKE